MIMGYLFIALTTFLNITKGFCSKKVSMRLESFSDTLDFNVVRNALCAFAGAVLILLFDSGNFTMTVMGVMICAISGFVTAFSYVVWLMALKTDAYVFASAANNGGFVVAVICGVLFFGEKLSVFKAAAIVLIGCALFFMTLYQASFGKKPEIREILILFLVFLSSGLNSCVQKWFTRALPECSAHLYTFYTFAFSVVVLVIYRVMKGSDGNAGDGGGGRLRSLAPYTVVMSISLYGATYFQALAAARLDAVVLYPLTNGLNLVGASLMAWIMLGEKPNRFSIVGTVLVFCSLVLSKF